MSRKSTTMPSKTTIALHWIDKMPELLIDLEDAHCWACGYCGITPKTYSQLNLERCHITADSLGGSVELDNLFLLCKQCHLESPDTLDRAVFFKWVKSMDGSYMKNKLDKYSKAVGMYLEGYDKDWASSMACRISAGGDLQDAYIEFANKYSTLHAGESAATSVATFAAFLGSREAA